MVKKCMMSLNDKSKPKYVIDFVLNKQLTAGPKARADVDMILKNKGYNMVILTFSRRRPFSSIKSILSVLYKISNSSDVIVQYPIGNACSSLALLFLLQIKHCNISILIHDVESLRGKGSLSYMEKSCFEKGKLVITHTPNMNDYLASFLKAPKLLILDVFDYLVDKMPVETSVRGNKIGFAGNLSKSDFIRKLGDVKCDFTLYGSCNSTMKDIFKDNIHYGGCFQQNDLSCLNVDWGLVWDGDEINSCSGKMGNYLRYNAPHKLSLYIAAGIPVILWSKSAEKEFVIKHNIGIAVDSLTELSDIISSIDDLNYVKMKQNVQQLSQQLRSGRMLMEVLKL